MRGWNKMMCALAAGLMMTGTSLAQVVVDGKNINEDKGIEYIQFIYHIDKKNLAPVFLIDYGFRQPASRDINLRPSITINNESINSLSPVTVLNKLYHAGWIYLGDHSYIEHRFERVHMFTLKRREGGMQATEEVPLVKSDQ